MRRTRVNPIDAVTNPGWHAIELVFKDNVAGARVLAAVHSVSNGGGIVLIGNVDSDDDAGSAAAQTRRDLPSSTSLDFDKQACCAMLTAGRSGPATLPDAAIARLLYQPF